MNELGIPEKKDEAKKFLEIQPESNIDMNDCKKFWNDIFTSEIEDDTGESFDESTEEKHYSRTESVEDFWNDIFSGDFFEGQIKKEIVHEGLTQEEKDYVKRETGWSDEIVDALGSMAEYEIYKKAGLVEAEINGKKCLIRTDIDWEQKDAFGSTNRERVAEGYAPLDKEGQPIQLHHIGQHKDSPLAELTFKEHRTGGNDSILHDKKKETEVHGTGNNWDNDRKEHWKNRLADNGGKNNE